MVAPFPSGPEKLEAVRSALPALAAGIYLNTGSVGPLPAETAAAMAEIGTWERDVGRGHPDSFDDLLARMSEARAGVAAVLGTDVGAVALTHSTTDAMNAGDPGGRPAAALSGGSSPAGMSTSADWGRSSRCETGWPPRSRSSMPATTATTHGRLRRSKTPSPRTRDWFRSPT